MRLRVPKGCRRQFVFPHVFFCCKNKKINGDAGTTFVCSSLRNKLFFIWSRSPRFGWRSTTERTSARVVRDRGGIEPRPTCPHAPPVVSRRARVRAALAGCLWCLWWCLAMWDVHLDEPRRLACFNRAKRHVSFDPPCNYGRNYSYL